MLNHPPPPSLSEVWSKVLALESQVLSCQMAIPQKHFQIESPNYEDRKLRGSLVYLNL